MELLDGKYQIEQLLGKGGMGAVYRATHLGTRRTVAVKVIHPELSTHNEFVARFRREAEAAGRLRHPNVVDVTDFGVTQTSRGPTAYLVMEYLDGSTLAEIIAEQGALPIPSVIDILEQVCSAVDEAHRAGIIHRDLKPDNIWLEPNRRGGYTVKVLDFGLVKLAAETSAASMPYRERASDEHSEHPTLLRAPIEEPATLFKVTHRSPAERTPSNGRNVQSRNAHTPSQQRAHENLTVMGSVMGTAFYMSPEQCRGENLDQRSDIYSLGVIAYRLLTGVTPFTGSAEELIELHKTAEPPPIREKNRKVSRKMARILMSALQKDPARRPQSAGGFASALRESWEGPGYLLRHAFAFYSEHFPTFLKISLLGYLPLMGVLAFINMSERFVDMPRLSPPAQIVFGVVTFVSMVFSFLIAHFTVTAATVPVVVQLVIAPLKSIRVGAGFAALRARWRVFAATSLLVMTMMIAGSALFLIPGLVVAIVYALYAPVAVMEELGVRATLRRSRALSSRALATVLIITILQFALPLLVWRAAVTTSFTLDFGDDFTLKQFGFNFSMSGTSALYQLLNVFVTPLTAIMLSLLYLKTRRAGGESDNF